MSVFRRRGHWCFRTVMRQADGSKRRVFRKASINTKACAEREERAEIERALEPPAPPPPRAMPTVEKYAEEWLGRRRELGIAAAAADETRLRLHVLPAIGAMAVDAVKPRHVRDLILELRAAGKLAARTILKASATLHAMFKSALVEELIATNPVIFEPGVLPKKVDADPEWRHAAIYTREEVQKLLSDERIPADRRMLYGLKMLAALRHSEAANLTWRQIDGATEPLGRINLGKTKSGVPRGVPIHPTLAKMLATWRLAGWFNTYGRQPTSDDLVVPTLTMKPRAAKEAQDALVGDLNLLELRVRAGKRMNRRGHDLRRTFISLALADGAHRDRLEWATHGPRGDIMSLYTTLPWAALCEEVSKLKITLLDGALVSLRHDQPSALTVRARKRWAEDRAVAVAPARHPAGATPRARLQALAVALENVVTPKGLEPLFSP